MLSLLVNAYACSPDIGSEPGMGWNWCINLAKHCQLHIITEGIHKEKIEKAMQNLPQGKNMHFYYNSVSEKVRRICHNQGDWRFYWYYEKWQRKTLKIAKNIIYQYPIDIIHQLNMVGFREPGYLWKIADIPFVWGPIGGMDNIPPNYFNHLGIKKRAFIILKRILNNWQIRHYRRVKKVIKRSNILIAATKGCVENIEKYHKRHAYLINETSCLYDQHQEAKTFPEKKQFDIVWVGRFFFTKKLDIALKTIAKVHNLPDIKFHIVGEGFEQENMYYRNLARTLGIDDICVWHGVVPNTQVYQLMYSSDLFLFTSVMETTSTVILEAISNQLPTLCFNICGFGPIVNRNVGKTIELSTPNQSVNDFANLITYLYHHRGELEEMSRNCIVLRKELSWDNKTIQMLNLYRQAKDNFHSL